MNDFTWTHYFNAEDFRTLAAEINAAPDHGEAFEEDFLMAMTGGDISEHFGIYGADSYYRIADALHTFLFNLRNKIVKMENERR